MSDVVVARMNANQVAVSAAVLSGPRFCAVANANAAPDAYERASSWGLAPLHAAARAGNADVVEALLCDAGLSPDARDAYGRTPLHCVLMGFLMSDGEARPLSSGLDLEARSRSTYGRLKASDANRGDVVLRDACRRYFPAVPFARLEDLAETATALLDADPTVDVPDAMGNTAFDLLTTGFYLAGRYHRRIARRLFDKIDAGYRDPWGMTPLMHAAAADAPESLEALLERGADAMDRCWIHHRTALHHAVLARASRSVDVLRTRTCLRSIDKGWMRPVDLARAVGAPAKAIRLLQ